MDERKAELKRLKKASKKARRRSVSPWKGLGILFLVLAMFLSAVTVVVRITENTIADERAWNVILEGKTAVNSAWDMLVKQVCPEYIGKVGFPAMTVFAITVALWLLFVLCLAMWIRGKKKWKKTEEFLSYRTMKTVLNDEKKMR